MVGLVPRGNQGSKASELEAERSHPSTHAPVASEAKAEPAEPVVAEPVASQSVSSGRARWRRR